MGRKPKLISHQVKEVRERLAKGEPTRALAKSYGVSISTISRLTVPYAHDYSSALKRERSSA
jgi:hypothetical protein